MGAWGRSSFASRTLWGPWAALPALAVYVFVMLRDDAPWRGDPMWTADGMGIGLFLIGPLVAGATAMDASRLTAWRGVFLAGATPRSYTVYVRAMLWSCTPIAAIHLLAYIIGLCVGGASLAVFDPLNLGTIFTQLLAIFWFGSTGSMLGRFVQPVLAGVVGAGFALAATYTLGLAGVGAAHGFALLDLGGATVPQLGLEYPAHYLGWQVILLAVMATVSLFMPVRFKGRRVQLFWPPQVMGIIALIACVFVGLSAGPGDRKMLAAPRPPTNCMGINPTICLYSEQKRVAGEVDARLRKLVQGAQDAGYGALSPARIEQRTSSYKPQGLRTFSLRIDPSALDDASWDQDAMQAMLQPNCPMVYGEEPPPEGYFLRMNDLVFTWSQIAGLDPGDFSSGMRLTKSETADTLAAWARCELS